VTITSELECRDPYDDFYVYTHSKQFIKKYLANTSAEQIGNFLHQAKIKFSCGYWDTNYGGSAWEKIAVAAEKMWREQPPLSVEEKIMLIDLAFHLEHNTATVFNKDEPNVQFIKEREKKILDTKSLPEDTNIMIEKFSLEIDDPDFIQFLKKLIETAQDFENISTISEGRD